MRARVIELPVIEIDAKTKEPEKRSELKKALITLLADPEIQTHLYNAMVSESSRRKNMAKSYR